MGIIFIIRKTDKETYSGIINEKVYVDKAMIDPSKSISEIVSPSLFINGEFSINNDKKDAVFCLGNNCYSESDFKSLINNPVPHEIFTDETEHLKDGSNISVSVPTELCFGDNCINKEHLRILNEKDGVLIEAANATPYVNERGKLYSNSPYYSKESDAFSNSNPNDKDLLPQKPFKKPFLQALKVDVHEGVTGSDKYKSLDSAGSCAPGNAPHNYRCPPHGGGWTSLYCSGSKFWRCPAYMTKEIHDGNWDAGHVDLDVIAAVSDEYNIDDAKFKLVPGSDTNVTCM
tara:strand:+ start:22011 stop:22874 length:864 start_codon:yes stop_codon:yes gene_type:complete